MGNEVIVYVGESEALTKLLSMLNYGYIVVINNSYVKDLLSNSVIKLSMELRSDVLVLTKYLLGFEAPLRFIIDRASNYQVILAYTVASILHDITLDVVVSLGGDLVKAPPTLTHSLGHGRTLDIRLRIIESLVGKECLSINEVMERLGISRETLVRHLYSLSKSGLVRIANERICSNIVNNT